MKRRATLRQTVQRLCTIPGPDGQPTPTLMWAAIDTNGYSFVHEVQQRAVAMLEAFNTPRRKETA